MATKILALDGLGDSKFCRKLEEMIERVPGISKVRIDFLSQKLVFDIEDRDAAETVDDVIHLLQRDVPEVTVKRIDVGTETSADHWLSFPQYAEEENSAEPEPLEESAESAEPEEDSEEEKIPKRPTEVMEQLYSDFLPRLCALAAAGGFFLLARLTASKGIMGTLFAVVSCLLSIVFSFYKRSGAPDYGYRATAIVTLITGGILFFLGWRIQSAAVMLACHVGVFLSSLLYARLDAKLEEIINIRPLNVTRLIEDVSQRVPLREIQVGDVIIVEKEETIPFDCVIQSGKSEVDNFLLSGIKEPLPVEMGDKLNCGMINLVDPLTVEVTGLQEFSAAARVRTVIMGGRKAGSLSEFAKWSSMGFMVLGLLVSAVTAFLSYQTNVYKLNWQWLVPALSMAILSGPCGAATSVLAVRKSGLGRSARAGILLNAGDTLETLAAANTVVTGYSGILTEGKYRISGFGTADKISVGQLLEVAAHAESKSSHPIARAILEKYTTGGKSIDSTRLSLCESEEGRGVRARFDRGITFVGGERLMHDMEIEVPRNVIGSVRVFVASQGDYMGSIDLLDMKKSHADQLARRLYGLGIERVVLLTGCDSIVAKTAAKELGFNEVIYEQNPLEKRAALSRLISEEPNRKQLIYAGNTDDFKLFASPCTCVAMCSDFVSEMLSVADVVIPSGEPIKLADAVKYAKSAQNSAKFNLLMILTVKTALMIASLTLQMPIWTAAAANAALAVLAALNAMRVLGRHG